MACALMVVLAGPLLVTNAWAKRPPPIEPELRIIEVIVSPEAYVPQEGPLEFSVQIELPSDLDEEALLEVSAEIGSPSKHSMRFLVSRQPVSTMASIPNDVTKSSAEDKSRVQVVLTWDGRDQRKEFMREGHYRYEVRVKLLAKTERGSRTFMVSWPKRGTIVVKNGSANR